MNVLSIPDIVTEHMAEHERQPRDFIADSSLGDHEDYIIDLLKSLLSLLKLFLLQQTERRAVSVFRTSSASFLVPAVVRCIHLPITLILLYKKWIYRDIPFVNAVVYQKHKILSQTGSHCCYNLRRDSVGLENAPC